MPLHSRTGQSHSTRVAAGIDAHDGGRPRDFYPVALPPAPSSSFSPLPRARGRLAWPRLASATCQHRDQATRHAIRLSGCQDPAASKVGALCLSRFLGRDRRSTRVCTGSTTVLAAYQSVNRPDTRFINQRANLKWPKWVTEQQGWAYCLDEAQSLVLGCLPSAPLSCLLEFPDGKRKKERSLFLCTMTQLNSTQPNPSAQQQHLRGHELSFRFTTSSTPQTLDTSQYIQHHTAGRQTGARSDRPGGVGDIKQLLRRRRRASRVVLAWPGLGCRPADPQLTRPLLMLSRASLCFPAGSTQPGLAWHLG